AQVVPLFLCPSDQQQPVSSAYGVNNLGPTNYAVCVGTGTTNGAAPYGSLYNADGMFRAQQFTRVMESRDGLSNTAMMSESTLGEGDENTNGPAPNGGSPQTTYQYVAFGTALTPGSCAAATNWNNAQRRGFMWASGEMRCASYNHFLPPNSPTPDCITNDI